MRNPASMVILALVFLSVSAHGRRARAVPLMPPRYTANVTYGSKAPPPATATLASSEKSSAAHSAWGWGAELGMLGVGHETDSDMLGMQALVGGRVFTRIPLFSSVFLKPSLGYFRKAERAGSSGVTQQIYEGGLGAYYSLVRGSRIRLMAGIVQRIELLRSTIVTPGASGDSPLAWRYRAGPAAGLAWGLSPGMSLVSDVEITFGGSNPLRTFAGFTAGVMFFFP